MKVETLVKHIAGESRRPAPGFCWKDFHQLIFVWFFGVLISVIPSILAFLQLPVNNLGYLMFFNNADILYICVTMTYVVVTSSILLKSQEFISMNITIIIFGSVFFTALKSGVRFPVLEQGTNLGVSIFWFFIFSVLINLGSIFYMCLNLKGER